MRKYLNKKTLLGTFIGALVVSAFPIIAALIGTILTLSAQLFIEIALHGIVFMRTEATIYLIVVCLGGLGGAYIANRRKNEKIRTVSR